MNTNDYNNNNYQQEPKSNAGLVAILAVLCAVVAAALIVGILFLTGVVSTTGDSVEGVPTGAAVPSGQETVPVETTMYVANVEYSIYFRSMPVEDSSNIITEILYGTPVTYIEQTDPVFAKIRYNGQEGYVKREYLSSAVPPAQASAYNGDTTVKKYMYVANVDYSIYLRSQPNESSNDNIICEIPLGTSVGFIERTNGTFSKIKYGDKIGYSKNIYLSDYYSGTAYMRVSGVEHSIYLRKTPSDEIDGNVICEIPVGSSVEYISNANGKYYKIRWNGQVGYATAAYLR